MVAGWTLALNCCAPACCLFTRPSSMQIEEDPIGHLVPNIRCATIAQHAIGTGCQRDSQRSFTCTCNTHIPLSDTRKLLYHTAIGAKLSDKPGWRSILSS